MATGLERPAWDTSKQSGLQRAPADHLNREYLIEAFGGVTAGNSDAVLAILLSALPKTWEGLPPGAFWNNGGIITRVEG